MMYLSLVARLRGFKFLGYSYSKTGITKFQTDFKDVLRFNYKPLSVDGKYGSQTDELLYFVVMNFQGMLRVTADGNAGKATLNACGDYQYEHGLTVDKICGPKTRAMLMTGRVFNFSGYKYASYDAFKCTCGGKHCSGLPFGMDRIAVSEYEASCTHFNDKHVVESGFRCVKRNKEVGGVTGSRHMLGRAFDVWSRVIKSIVLVRWFDDRQDIRYTYKNNGGAAHADVK